MNDAKPGQPGLIGRVAGAVTGRVVDAVPPDVILDHIDVDALLDRVDVNKLLDRIDVDRLMSRVDLNALLTDVQIDELVRRAGIPAIVAETTGQLAGSTLTSVRRQLARLDSVLGRHARGRAGLPADPTGRYAGAATRAVAALLDYVLLLASYAAVVGAGDLLARYLFDTSIKGVGGLAASIALGVWTAVFFIGSIAVLGRTVGKAVLGLRVLRTDLRPPGPWTALVRYVTFPLSTAFLGLGLLLILVHPRARALHDLAARTIVVYDWGTQPDQLTSPLDAYLRRHEAA